MRILVCGNGPSILESLKFKHLKNFDKVIRINQWQPIPGPYDNRCEAWVCYPPHHLNQADPRYDLRTHAKLTKEIWLAHPIVYRSFEEVFKKKPDFALSFPQRDSFCAKSGLQVPRTGVLALYMASLITPDVWATGFDFYQGKAYYYNDKPSRSSLEHLKPHDHPLREKKWFDSQVAVGQIRLLI